MNTYLYAMKTAFLFFPLIALILMLPYMISQYKKYGSILVFKSIIIYSFVLYLVVIYFLVILPLPPIEEVKNYTNTFVQLKPFYTFSHIQSHTTFQISSLSTYGVLFQNAYFYQFIYNILITIPFGIYLHYYFKCNFKKTFLYSFLLSLFFELTQLSGLYGIYPRPYRIFDVDDLITNTLGGVIGFWLSPLFCFFLPTRNQMDEKAYKKGEKVTFSRKLVAFGIDFVSFLFVLLILYICLKFTLKINSFYVILLLAFAFYFIFLPVLYKGFTLGRYLVNIRIVSKEDTDAEWYQYCLREITFFWIYIFGIPILNKIYVKNMSFLVNKTCLLLLFIQGFVLMVSFLKVLLKKEDLYIHEKISRTKYKSTIEVPNTEK